MSENRTSRSLLIAAGASSFLIASTHLVILLMGPPGYCFFGAPSLAVEAERGSLVPAALCIAVAALLSIWGLYALAGAGVVRRLPPLRSGILLIGAIYLLRGLAGMPQLVRVLRGDDVAPVRDLLFSLVSGATGALYLSGLYTVRHARPGTGTGHPPSRAGLPIDVTSA